MLPLLCPYVEPLTSETLLGGQAWQWPLKDAIPQLEPFKGMPGNLPKANDQSGSKGLMLLNDITITIVRTKCIVSKITSLILLKTQNFDSKCCFLSLFKQMQYRCFYHILSHLQNFFSNYEGKLKEKCLFVHCTSVGIAKEEEKVQN